MCRWISAPARLVCLLGLGLRQDHAAARHRRLERQDSGVITLSGRDISHAEPQERDYGILFQSYALFPNLTVAQNVAYGLSGKRAHRKHVAGRVEEMLTLVGLAGAANKYPGQISGGQQQRVAWRCAGVAVPAAAGRAHVGAGRPRARAPAHRIARAAEAPVHHHADGRTIRKSHGHGRPHRRHERRRHRAVRHAARTLRQPGSAFIADFVGEANWLPFERIDAHRARVGRQELAVDEALGAASGRLFVRPEAVRVSAVRRNSPTPCWPTCSTACS